MMKKVLYFTFIMLILSSCAGSKMINECQSIANKEMTQLEGFDLERTSVNKTKGLKLAIPEKYDAAKNVVLITYKSKEEDYRTCSCYFNKGNKLMGYKTK